MSERSVFAVADGDGNVAEKLVFDFTPRRYSLRGRVRVYKAWRGPRGNLGRREAFKKAGARLTNEPPLSDAEVQMVHERLAKKYNIAL